MRRTKEILRELEERLRDLREHVHAIADKVSVLWNERYARKLKEQQEKRDARPDERGAAGDP